MDDYVHHGGCELPLVVVVVVLVDFRFVCALSLICHVVWIVLLLGWMLGLGECMHLGVMCVCDCLYVCLVDMMQCTCVLAPNSVVLWGSWVGWCWWSVVVWLAHWLLFGLELPEDVLHVLFFDFPVGSWCAGVCAAQVACDVAMVSL